MTMPTSSFEAQRFLPLYRNILRRNRGYFALYSVLLFLFYPLPYILEAFRYDSQEWLAVEPIALPFHFFGTAQNYTFISALFCSGILLFCAFTLALKQNSYLFSKSAADVYHALPISRSTLVSSNIAASMTMLWAPLVGSNIVIAVINILQVHSGSLGLLLLDTLFWMIVTLCVYLVVTLVCVQVGRVFDAFLHSGGILAALPALGAVFILLCESFLHGFQVDSDWMRALLYTSPASMVIDHFLTESAYDLAAAAQGVQTLAQDFIRHWIVMGLYLVLAALLILLIFRTYVRRPSEMADSPTSTGSAPLFVQLAATCIGGILFGMLFYAVNNDGDFYTKRWIMVLWSAVGAVVCFVILDVILNRGFKALRQHLPIGAGMTGVTLLALSVVLTGLFGFETRVPEVTNVASVNLTSTRLLRDMHEIGHTEERIGTNGLPEISYLYGGDSVFTGETAIQAITQFHRETAALPREKADISIPFFSGYAYVEYKLKNGASQLRYYSGSPLSAGQALLPLLTDQEFLQAADPLFSLRYQDIVACSVLDGLGGSETPLLLSQAEAKELVEAMRQDRLAMTLSTVTEPGSAPAAYVNIIAKIPQEPDVAFADGKCFAVSADTPATLRLLTQWDILPSSPDLSSVTAVTAEQINWSNWDAQHFPDEEAVRDYVFQEGLLSTPDNSSPELLKDIASYSTDIQDSIQKYGSYEATVEVLGRHHLQVTQSAAAIRDLTQGIRAAWRGDEPAYRVTFHRRDASETISVIIPASVLSSETIDALEKGIEEFSAP